MNDFQNLVCYPNHNLYGYAGTANVILQCRYEQKSIMIPYEEGMKRCPRCNEELEIQSDFRNKDLR